MKGKLAAALQALLAAALYAVSTPFSKLLLAQVGPVMMAALLYFGAGAGMALVSACTPGRRAAEPRLTRAELPYTLGMIVLDIAAPICLMLGLKQANAANASLLGNFEIVATSLIAFFAFRERISGRMWLAIALITAASVLLSFGGEGSWRFSAGSVYVLLACACWGLENNCTRKLSSKSAMQIVVLKGVFSGLGSLVVALLAGERLPRIGALLCVLALGFVAYGMSIFWYVRAQSQLGAAKTSAYYAVAPFIGALLSLLVLGERLSPRYGLAAAVMLLGTALVVADTLAASARETSCETRG